MLYINRYLQISLDHNFSEKIHLPKLETNDSIWVDSNQSTVEFIKRCLKDKTNTDTVFKTLRSMTLDVNQEFISPQLVEDIASIVVDDEYGHKIYKYDNGIMRENIVPLFTAKPIDTAVKKTKKTKIRNEIELNSIVSGKYYDYGIIKSYSSCGYWNIFIPSMNKTIVAHELSMVAP